GSGVRQPAGARRPGRRSSSRHHHQLQACDADLQHAQRRRTDAEGLRGRRHGGAQGGRQVTRMRLDLKKHYSSREVAAITGLSARQLQWWDARKLIKPSISSHRTEAGGYTERRYSPIDLFELAVLADLRRNGLSVAKIRQLLDTLRRRFGIRLFDAIGGG